MRNSWQLPLIGILVLSLSPAMHAQKAPPIPGVTGTLVTPETAKDEKKAEDKAGAAVKDALTPIGRDGRRGVENRPLGERDHRALRQQEGREAGAGRPRVCGRAHGRVLERHEAEGDALLQTEELSGVLPSDLLAIAHANRARVEPRRAVLTLLERIVDREQHSVDAQLRDRLLQR